MELDGGREGSVRVRAALALGVRGLDPGRQDFGKEGRSQTVSVCRACRASELVTSVVRWRN